MSGAISNGSGIMPTLMRNVDKLNATNDALSAALTSGVTSDSYAGLGDQAYAAISLEPQISATAAWQTNATVAQTNLSITQTALTSISSIATSLQTSLLSLQTTSSTSTIATISSAARQQLTALTALLNTKNGDSYVFAGTASDQPPVTTSDLATSSLVSGIIGAVATVGTAGATATEAATLASASLTSPANVFSTQLSMAATALAPQIQVGQNQSIATGIVATQGGLASTVSTGSAIRDLIRSLATVAGLSGADSSSAGFQSLVADTSSQMSGVTQGLAGLTASVGTLQDNATSLGSSLSDMNDALTSQLDTTKNADPATTRTQQVAVQNQLTASYTLIADMKTLNLAQYI
jgi:flagellar hook-associated protein 3 FlgL